MSYGPSIMEEESDRVCWICGRQSGKLDRHEIFHGAYRKKSQEIGTWLTLCHGCHMELHHVDPKIDKRLKKACQKRAMYLFDWDTERFIKEFGKNYL